MSIREVTESLFGLGWGPGLCRGGDEGEAHLCFEPTTPLFTCAKRSLSQLFRTSLSCLYCGELYTILKSFYSTRKIVAQFLPAPRKWLNHLQKKTLRGRPIGKT